jgi:uncharacterized membrane protein
VERLAALSDGIFAVAMTLLVLDLLVPAAVIIHSGRDLQHALLSIFSTYWSIGFIVLVQLYCAISRQIGSRT